MDGTSRTVLHSTNLVWPNALTLDYSSQTLYWMDASLDKLESSSVNGFNRRLLSTNSRIQHPFGITIYQSVLYWSDWQSNSILSARVTSPGTVSTVLSGLLLDPMGIHVVSLDRQPTGMAALAVSFTVAVFKSIYLCLQGICDIYDLVLYLQPTYSSLQSMLTVQWWLQSLVFTELSVRRQNMCMS